MKGLADAESYFTVGLFSILDSPLDTPMATVTTSLPFSAEVIDTLVECKGDGAINREDIGKVYLDSIERGFDAASGL